MSCQIPQRVAAIHDLSCFGRCALTVVIPTLSVMGYQVVPVPTALLSTHTGGFTDLHFRDMTEDMEKIASHFSSLGVAFSSVYTGFLGSVEQIETVTRFIETFDRPDRDGKRPLILVDPVMGDDGELYSTYTNELMQGMKRLAHHASVLTPNLTEACFLTDTPYFDSASLTPEEAKDRANALLDKLERFGAERVVITGIFLSDGMLLNLGKDCDGRRFSVSRPVEAHAYPGTGDVFASVLLGALMQSGDFEAACREAADFIAVLIKDSATLPTPTREGVALESHLWRLCHPRGDL